MLGAGAASEGPSILALTRQNLPPVRTEASSENLCARGAYRLKARRGGAQGVILIATGSEVEIALGAAERLEAQGIGADVVSMPCTERFDAQPARLSRGNPARRQQPQILRVSIEAGTTFGWERYTGLHGLRIGIDRFGVSAPATDAYEYFGLTPDKVAARVLDHHENKGNRMTKVAINGFGRIGRLVARAILERPDCGLELVSVNDLADAKSNAWLFKHDSVHGKFPGEVTTDGNDIIVNGKRIHVTAERDPGQTAAQGERRRARARMHRLLRRPCRRREAYRGGREAGADLGAGQGRRPDRGLWRQRRQADRRGPDRLQRVLHHQLPGAGGQGAQRRAGHRARADDHVHAYTNDQKILDQIHPTCAGPARRRCR